MRVLNHPSPTEEVRDPLYAHPSSVGLAATSLLAVLGVLLSILFIAI